MKKRQQGTRQKLRYTRKVARNQATKFARKVARNQAIKYEREAAITWEEGMQEKEQQGTRQESMK